MNFEFASSLYVGFVAESRLIIDMLKTTHVIGYLKYNIPMEESSFRNIQYLIDSCSIGLRAFV